MTSEDYQKAIRDNLKYQPTWPLIANVGLGDIGLWGSDGVFNKLSTLSDQRVPFENDPPSLPGSISLTSGASVTFTAKGSATASDGSTLIETKAGAVIEFQKENSVYFETTQNAVIHRIASLQSLAENLVQLYDQGLWELKHWVVYEVVTSDATTVIISKEAGARLEVTAEVESLANLAEANLGLTVVHSKNIGTRMFAEKCTPLYKVLRIIKKFLQKAEVDFGTMSSHPANIGVNSKEEFLYELDDGRTFPIRTLDEKQGREEGGWS